MNPENFLEKLKQNPRPVVVDFWASWCGPCSLVRPIIASLKNEFKGRVDVWEVNADDAPDLMRTYGVMSIPTLIVFESGREVERYVGARPAGFYTYVFKKLAESDVLPHDPPAPGIRIMMLVGGLLMTFYGLDGGLYYIAAAGGLLLLTTFFEPVSIYKQLEARLRKRKKK